jgi:hypothetical protein
MKISLQPAALFLTKGKILVCWLQCVVCLVTFFSVKHNAAFVTGYFLMITTVTKIKICCYDCPSAAGGFYAEILHLADLRICITFAL